MFMRFRRIFAVGIDSVCLFPIVFAISVLLYNQFVNFASLNVEQIEFILWINQPGVTLYMVFLFPLLYVGYEFICYLLFRKTIGQYFMHLNLKQIDFLTMLFRMFFTISLQVITIGLFNFFNILVTIVTGKTIIDYLSHSAPQQQTIVKLKRPIGKLWALMGIVTMMSAASVFTAISLKSLCFEITCIEKVVLKDAIELQLLKKQLQPVSESEQQVNVTTTTYTELASNFPTPTALEYVSREQQGYDLIRVAFNREFEVYSTNANELITLNAQEPWQILTTKNELDPQKWQVYIWSEQAQQFLPVRVVLTIQNQNSYNWMLNVNESADTNSQLLLTFAHDFGTESKILLEK